MIKQVKHLSLGLCMLLTGCSLPSLEGRPESMALTPADIAQTSLGRSIIPLQAPHGSDSGFHLLSEPKDAFAARVMLCRTAEKTLDVQYYIWKPDITGTLLLDELLEAAQRGVRVRLLLDDNGTGGMDHWLASLDNHENVEVRLFNPFSVRRPKALGFITHFSRANRRMHNKSLTADNSATIVGGRNIADEYFAATNNVAFADLDVLAIGPVVQETSNDFDRYWASASAYPVADLLPATDQDPMQQLHARAEQLEQGNSAALYVEAIRRLPFIKQLLQGQLALEWAPAYLVSDDPIKGLGKAQGKDLMVNQFGRVIGNPQQHLELISPYFVPTQAGVEYFSQLRKQGVQVRILTNALEATDVAAVHSGYAKRRTALLKAGIELYEMPRTPGISKHKDLHSPFGSSGSSLHAKTFAVDNQQVYIGSFNFDPRSLNLNTEMGVVIKSPHLADMMQEAFDNDIKLTTYQVKLTEQGQLYWLDRRGDEEQRLDSEPGTGMLQRSLIRVLGWLPIEWLL